jgi:2-polyprenyl-6-methoxyphenol hydroxylase-like FAD-dependent oxidoreductase
MLEDHRPAAHILPNTQQVADVLIIGAGISGTLAATVLGRSGYRVTLVDRHETYPPDFRAEHLDGTMIDQFERLGLLSDLTVGLYRGETVVCGRRGRVIEVARTVNFALRYEQMVNTARRLLPPQVTTIIGRVVDVTASDSVQTVNLADGRTLFGRILIVAAGLGYGLSRRLGITRHTVREAHSLTFGFNMVPKGRPDFDHSYVVYQGEKLGDRIDYLAIFKMGDGTRANLFTYRDYREPWTLAFRADPVRALRQTLPGLSQVIGDFDIEGKVEVRAMDLYKSEGHVRDGVVLIGDVYQTACPAAGNGLSKVLTDIERLCLVHLPVWLATEGMGRDKIAQFYKDPVKRACHAHATHDAEYRRSVTIDHSLGWRFHRTRVYIHRRLRVWAGQQWRAIRSLTGRVAPALPNADPGLSMGIIKPGRPDHVV